jgi:hypothetical protein
MVMKSRKKSSKKSSKKTAKKKAQVELDPSTVLQFEAHLREGLVASGAVLMSTEMPRLKAGARVELDSDAISQIAEILRDGLVSSAAVLASEFPETTQATRKASKSKPKATRKGRSRAPSKKR